MTENHEANGGGNQPEGGIPTPTERRPLTLREYLGVLAPNFYTREELKERAKDPRPLSVGEYLRVKPLPDLDDLIDFSKWAAKSAQRVWNRVTGHKPQQPQ